MAPIFPLLFIGCLLFAVYGALIDYYRRAWKSIPLFIPPAESGIFASARPPAEGRIFVSAHPPAEGLASGFGGLAPRDSICCRTKISILVPARNEALTLSACLESLSRQSYPGDLYQVIVIDDHSTDKTWEILQGLPYPDLNKLFLRLSDAVGDTDDRGETASQTQPTARAMAHKKFAIETGIRHATGELIVTTDADCTFHPEWLRTLATFYEEKGAKFIAAPVRIGEKAFGAGRSFGGRRSLLSIFQTLDFITLQGITGAAVYRGFHSMCNGANPGL